MLRFIFYSAVIIALSFSVAPIFFGISKERQKMTQISQNQSGDKTLSFEEIYDLASGGIINDPSQLNNIEPAAGENNIQTSDKFSDGFTQKLDPALSDKSEIIIE